MAAAQPVAGVPAQASDREQGMPGMNHIRRTLRQRLMVRVKVWLECEDPYTFGLVICEVLQAVDRSGSIKQAARDVGMSYRHV